MRRRSGRLDDPYTGTTVAFVRGPATSPLVEIDHVVALAGAWRAGAATWTAGRRELFANDPLNLLAVTRAANQDKAGLDAARWLPPRVASRCVFVARQVAVKQRWALTVTPQEKAAVARVLATCPAEPLTTGEAEHALLLLRVVQPQDRVEAVQQALDLGAVGDGGRLEHPAQQPHLVADLGVRTAHGADRVVAAEHPRHDGVEPLLLGELVRQELGLQPPQQVPDVGGVRRRPDPVGDGADLLDEGADGVVLGMHGGHERDVRRR